jgi:hypothetical protein
MLSTPQHDDIDPHANEKDRKNAAGGDCSSRLNGSRDLNQLLPHVVLATGHQGLAGALSIQREQIYLEALYRKSFCTVPCTVFVPDRGTAPLPSDSRQYPALTCRS